MNAEHLLWHYEQIADAPDAIARLRRFILDLAVRGRLVPQDPNDEPAAHIIRLPNSFQADAGEFALPYAWRWVSVEYVGQTRLGKMLDKAKNKGNPKPYLRNSNVRWFDFDLTDLLEMPFEDDELEEFSLKSSDVLICEGGEPGRAAVWDGRMHGLYFQKAIHRVRFKSSVNSLFFVNAIRASADDGRLKKSFTGSGIKHFTGKGLDAYRFPLPPLGEQGRIVAKVDELMALCDRLEATRVTREAVRDRLAAASLARLNAPDPETFQTDARFVLDALAVLTTRPDQIKQFREATLSLAVRGKLVPQDPSDEPVSPFTATRPTTAILHSNGDGRRSTYTEGNQDSLPTGWMVAKGELVAEFIDPQPSHRTPPQYDGGIPYIGYGDIASGGQINFDGARKISPDVLVEHRRRYTLQKGDFVIGKIGTIGDPVFLEAPFNYTLSANLILFSQNPQ
jgi:type I restriction enzyme S subunit